MLLTLCPQEPIRRRKAGGWEQTFAYLSGLGI